MSKYFMCETGNEVNFGDIIKLDLTKEEDGKTIYKVVSCKFHPLLVDSLLEQGVIEAVDNEEEIENEEMDGVELEEILDSILSNQAELFETIDKLENRITELEGGVAELTENVK